MSFQSANWISFGLIDYLRNFFLLVISNLKFPLFRPSFSQSQPSAGNSNRKNNNAWPVFRGLLLAFPILFVFILLFSSADLVFEQRTIDLINKFNLRSLPEFILRGAIVLLIANLIAGVFLYVATKSQRKVRNKIPIIGQILGFTEACIVISSVLVLFLSFIGIQFQYLFFPKNNISILGFTFSEYARRGFFELNLTAILVLILLLTLNVVAYRKTKMQKNIFSILNICLLISVLIILISSFLRLQLYESAYGFTKLRTYAHVFMIWLGILLIFVVVLERINRSRELANVAIIILIGFSVTLNLINVDAFITHQNIRRTISGEDLDISYLSTLTNDAVPTLIREYLSPTDISEETRSGIGAALTCFQIEANSDKTQNLAWQSFHLSDWRATQKLESIDQQLEEYMVQKEEWFTSVTSPAGVEYTCQNYSMYD